MRGKGVRVRGRDAGEVVDAPRLRGQLCLLRGEVRLVDRRDGGSRCDGSVVLVAEAHRVADHPDGADEGTAVHDLDAALFDDDVAHVAVPENPEHLHGFVPRVRGDVRLSGHQASSSRR